MLPRSCSLLSILVLTCAAPGSARAAELGDARVSSHVGQQLVADVELAMVEDPAAPVAVRMASPEVYRGAGIVLPQVASSLNLSVMRRDGRQFLHVTSLRPVDADHLHLYLELTDKGQRAVRLVTLWLTPDPDPAPAAVVQPAPAPVPASAPVPAPAPLSKSTFTSTPSALPMALPARVPVPLPVPARAASPTPAPVEREKPAPLLSIRRPAPPAVIHAGSQPAACGSQPDEAQACAAVGVKNAALREQLVKLEDKVKKLQQLIGGAPASASAPVPASTPAAASTPAPAAQASPAEARPSEPEPAPPRPAAAEPIVKPVGPKPISSIKPLVPHKPKTPPPDEGGAPWRWIGAAIALLAAIGGGTAFALKRRARARNIGIPAEPGMLDKLRQGVAARSTGAAAAAGAQQKVAEPTME